MRKKKTNRGFYRIDFKDEYGEECSLQKSSLATGDCVWLGVNNPKVNLFEAGKGWTEMDLGEQTLTRHTSIHSRMHLTRKQVKKLIPHLQQFVKTGDL